VKACPGHPAVVADATQEIGCGWGAAVGGRDSHGKSEAKGSTHAKTGA